MIVRGVGGLLLAGGREAARLRAWEIIESGAEYAVQADLGSANEFYLDMLDTFTVQLQLGSRELRWRNVRVHRAGSVITFRTNSIGGG